MLLTKNSGYAGFASSVGYDQRALIEPRSSGVGAGLFRLDREGPAEIEMVIPTGMILVCVHLTGKIEWSCQNGNRRYDVPGTPDTFNLSFGGEKARLLVKCAHADVVHFYLPRETVEAYLQEDGLETGRLELLDP